jgi:cytochrome c1
VKDPDTIKSGALMPAMQLDQQNLDALVAYLASLQ